MRRCLIAIGLIVLVASALGPVARNGFVAYDDPLYVVDNPHVRDGLTRDGIAWAFTTFHATNWHPLTWISHMVDVEACGLDASCHHLASLIVHSLNTVLLFLLLASATGRNWPAAMAAALFGVHPLHVESVAWVSERKDLLSALFWLLSMAAYGRYARRPGLGRYLLVAAAFGFGLLSKPMVVTLPVALLLLDFWPLARFSPGPGAVARGLRLLAEKLPLLALSAASAIVTVLAQRSGEAVAARDVISWTARLGSALRSYAWYLGKTFWPTSLAVVYPHPATMPGGLAFGTVVVSAVILVGITWAALAQWKRRPYLACGWLWYLVTLLPVIGIVQVGLQGVADRYAYLPSIGIFVGLAWGIADLAGASRTRRAAVACVVGATVLALGVAARAQVSYWRDGFALYERAVNVVPNNWLALHHLGVARRDRGDLDLAVRALTEAGRIQPASPGVWTDLGMSHAARGDDAAAAACFEKVVLLTPNDESAWINLGVASALSGRTGRVREVHQRLERLNPESAREMLERIAQVGAPR